MSLCCGQQCTGVRSFFCGLPSVKILNIINATVDSHAISNIHHFLEQFVQHLPLQRIEMLCYLFVIFTITRQSIRLLEQYQIEGSNGEKQYCHCCHCTVLLLFCYLSCTGSLHQTRSLHHPIVSQLILESFSALLSLVRVYPRYSNYPLLSQANL